jgi:hypothetical protein
MIGGGPGARLYMYMAVCNFSEAVGQEMGDVNHRRDL